MDENSRIKNLHLDVPDSIYYIPNFVTQEEEEFLLRNVNGAPKPKWTILSNRRLQNWGGIPHPKGMLGEPLPQWLQTYAEKLNSLGIFEGHTPNHVLVNEYLPGQGIMPHEDGPLFYPTVTTINLGCHIVLDFYNANNTEDRTESCAREKKFSLLLQPRSLLILKHDAYEKFLHGIDFIAKDLLTKDIANLYLCEGVDAGVELERKTRVSLTIRYVPKVLKANILKLLQK